MITLRRPRSRAPQSHQQAVDQLVAHAAWNAAMGAPADHSVLIEHFSEGQLLYTAFRAHQPADVPPGTSRLAVSVNDTHAHQVLAVRSVAVDEHGEVAGVQTHFEAVDLSQATDRGLGFQFATSGSVATRSRA